MKAIHYDIKDLRLFKEYANYAEKYAGTRGPGINFSIMKELPTTESRIAFIDEYYKDGRGIKNKASTILAILEKFDAVKDSLPVDSMGYVKTVSLKAWLKKNDPDGIFDTYYRYGSYSLVNASWKESYINSRVGERFTKEEKDRLVADWTSSVLFSLRADEEKYYLENDPVVAKVKAIQKYANTYGTLNAKYVEAIRCNGSSVLDAGWRKTWGHEAIPEDSFDKIISAYEDIEKVYTAASKKLSDIIGTSDSW